MRRGRALILAGMVATAVVAAAVQPASGGGGVSSVVAVAQLGGADVYVFQARPDTANEMLVVRQDDGGGGFEYIFSDVAAVILDPNGSANALCAQVGDDVVCDATLELLVKARNGADRVELQLGVLGAPPVRSKVQGGGGGDRLIGGPLRQILEGNGGKDVLRGGDDGDKLIGGKKADKFFGEAGNDRLEAKDRTEDRRIDCGDGNADSAVTDGKDPRPIACEG